MTAAAFSSLGGSRVVSGIVAVPLYGIWVADVSLATQDPVGPSASLVIGNLTMQCFVYRQFGFAGERRCRVVGGYGGWRKIVSARHYANSVRLSIVLQDAANETGEIVNVPNDRSIGDNWVRENAPASRLLRSLCADWYVAPSGVTQIAAWPTVNVNSSFDVPSHDGGTGRVVVATEDYAAWLPGCSFSTPTLGTAPLVGKGTVFRMSADGVTRVEVMTA